LNGSADLIFSDVVQWGLQPEDAIDLIEATILSCGADATRQAHLKVRADLVTGQEIKQPAALFPHVARRMMAGRAAMGNTTERMVAAIRAMGATQ